MTNPDRNELIDKMAQTALTNAEKSDIDSTYYNVSYAAFEEHTNEELLAIANDRLGLEIEGVLE